jgi:cyclophilin family peptidyl-prolyl cis-trans isomerase
MHNLLRKLILISIFSAGLTGQLLAQTKHKTAAKKPAVASSGVAKPGSTGVDEPWRQLPTKERLVEITTDYGVMVAKLYDSTPLHRDNFVKLVQQKFYDSLLFHRVIDQFMIQGGDPASKTAADGVHLGSGSVAGERIPAEFKPYFFHKKGALAAARDENPGKASSNCQFYIVQGKSMTKQELDNAYDQRIRPANPLFSYTPAQREIYNRIGGTPFLDQSYTVFGEVVSGLDVIDKIAKAPKDATDRPLQNIRFKIRLLN